jgi:hypothetical protein
MVLAVKWVDGGREPQCAPDPRFPSGVDVDMSEGRKACETALGWPARRCGVYVVTCDVCGLTTVVTTAGRPDDPRWVKVACKTN